jgi:hypothetical protein
MSTVKESPRSSRKPQPHARKHKRAAQLTDLTLGHVGITFRPTMFHDGDDDAQGHLYLGRLNTKHEEEFLDLDDRRAEPLEIQLVAELRRIGEMYTTLAKYVEAQNHLHVVKWLGRAKQ